MRQTSIKSDEVADLLEEVTRLTGERKVDAVRHALEARLHDLRASGRAERTLAWLDAVVWPELAPQERGRAPSKEEQEELLGF